MPAKSMVKRYAGQTAHDREAQINQALANQPTIKIDDFEGPLDLLLHLIRRAEMDIYDIQISAITSQYLGYLHSMKVLKLDVAGEYLVMAATLMTIKSRLLLPKPEPMVEPADEPSDDPRAELVAQLLEYRRYQQAAGELRQKEQDRRQYFTRPASSPPEEITLAPVAAGLSIADLQAAFDQMLVRRQQAKPVFKTVTPETFSVRHQMEKLLAQLKPGQPQEFTALFDQTPGTDELVTTFLAMLELIKADSIRCDQATINGPIMVYENKQILPATPSFEDGAN